MDLKEKLKAFLKEEEKSGDDYTKMAAEFDAQYPDEGYGSILRTMAHEEALHKKHLADILADIT